ncbi:hypothetical protein [Methanolobus bombayensis]|uniref:hypothetical protein n=1 Tax=Methanolobus bombayensis TaxID=38023 RepID=UPI001AE0FD26|nr:hypothetical protein [Methanolobus bombayensis]MBP1910090.1 hypothetical protein [Methanolobus bombayensis]
MIQTKKINSDDKAQLLLIAGFAVGVGIVVLTIMLNNVIYASNIASEASIDTSRYEIANAAQITTEAYEDAYRYATLNGSFNNTDFENYIGSYSEMAEKNFAMSGFTYNIENNTLNEAYFTRNGLAGGRDDWTVIKNINTTSGFAVEIPDVSRLGNSTNSLTIAITNRSGLLWSLDLYNSSGNINITVSDQSSVIGTYTASSHINITGDRIDFSTPENFYFNSHTDGGDYSINILNGSNAVGYCSFSGTQTSGDPYVFARYWIVNPSVEMTSGEMRIVRNTPISLPGRNIG